MRSFMQESTPGSPLTTFVPPSSLAPSISPANPSSPLQLLGLIGPDNADPTSSAAIMDLGGASTQIVFEPSFAPSAKLPPGDHVYDLDFAGTPHVLYQHSRLGYGLMQARRAVHNLVAFSYVWQSAPKAKPVVWDELSIKDRIHNPCMFKGEEKVVELDPPGREKVTVTMVGTGAEIGRAHV